VGAEMCGLIRSKTTIGQPNQIWTEPSKAKILDEPLFIPPSAIQPLPAAEPIDQDQWPGKIDPLKDQPKIKSPRQAIPTKNDLIR